MRINLAMLVILALVAFTGCSSDIVEPNPPATIDAPAITEMWVIVAADGTETTYTSELELWDAMEVAARETSDPDGWLGGQNAQWGPQDTCWHWTFDTGTWWIRHCGYTLSQECYYFSGPTGTMEPCGDMGPGGNW
jgi:hypothetical protein